MDIELRNNHFKLLWQRAIYWQEQQVLIVSDTHFGKGGHFRKGGIAVPGAMFNNDIQTINSLVLQYQPTQIIVTGDMFHSRHNNEVSKFADWRHQYPDLKIQLIKGNHDILAKDTYYNMKIDVIDTLIINEFLFVHEPQQAENKFCFSGHIHPGIKLQGNARQSVWLPCFHFTNSSCTLPAFSLFTGLVGVNAKEGDNVYAIVGGEVMAV